MFCFKQLYNHYLLVNVLADAQCGVVSPTWLSIAGNFGTDGSNRHTGKDGVNNLASPMITFGKQLEVRPVLFSKTDGSRLDPNNSP